MPQTSNQEPQQACIVSGPFQGTLAEVLSIQRLPRRNSEKQGIAVAYTLKLPSGWVLNIQANCVEEL